METNRIRNNQRIILSEKYLNSKCVATIQGLKMTESTAPIEIRDVSDRKLTKKDLEYTSKRVTKGEWVGRFIVDTKNLKIYAIPQNIDHPEFVALLEKTTISELKRDPAKYNHHVAVSIVVQDDIVTRTLIGISGFEMVMAGPARALLASKEKNKDRAAQILKAPIQYHTNEQLQRAQMVAYQYLLDGEFPLASDYKEQYVRVI